MGQDWIDRDRLLTEVHRDIKHIVEWAKSHDNFDNERFKNANTRISWIEKVAYIGIGGLAVLNILVRIIFK